MIRKIAVALLVCTASICAHATYSGNDLLVGLIEGDKVQEEKQNANTAKAGVAIGYVMGVSDTLHNSRVTCLPKAATIGQVVAVVQKFLGNNPAKRHLSADILIEAAIQDAFPCTQKK